MAITLNGLHCYRPGLEWDVVFKDFA